MLGRERLWSQGDQFSLFVIWLCQLPGTVTGSGLQLSTALASWIPTPFPSQALPTHTNQGEFHPSGLFHHLCSPQAPLEWHHWPYRAFVGGFAPWHHWLQGVCHLHELQGLSLPGAAGVCYLLGLQVCPRSILIFQPSKFHFSFLFLGFCHVFLQSAQICSYFQSI